MSDLDVGKEKPKPPDGGVRAWVVMIACFLCNGIVLGLNNAYGVIYVRLVEQLEAHDDPNASSKASLMGSLTFGATLCCSPLAGILADRIGIRLTVFFGATIASLGLLAASLVPPEYIFGLYLTYGFLLGLGLSLIYSPSLTIVGHYFDKKFGVVNGFVTAGSAVFTLLMYYILDFLLDNLGLSGCFRVLALMMVVAMVSAVSFKPVLEPAEKQASATCMSKIMRVENWRNPRYVVWIFSIFFGLFGYLVPLVHLVKYVKVRFPAENGYDGKELLLCMQLASLIARLIFGRIADVPFIRANRVLLQQGSFVAMGILTMCLAIPTGSWWLLVALCLVLGLADGCFWCAEGPIAYDLCGSEGAAQALGFLKGLMGISFAAGPPVAGFLYDHTGGDYSIAFILAGCPPIIAALSLIYVSRKRS